MARMGDCEVTGTVANPNALRATRAYITGFGTSGLLLAAVAGWASVGGALRPVQAEDPPAKPAASVPPSNAAKPDTAAPETAPAVKSPSPVKTAEAPFAGDKSK